MRSRRSSSPGWIEKGERPRCQQLDSGTDARRQRPPMIRGALLRGCPCERAGWHLIRERGNSTTYRGYGWLHDPPDFKDEMHCREFRRKHDAFIDDTLRGVDIDAMEVHRRVCEPCSLLDTRVRRALLIARNLPSIQPSADFRRRLHERLEQERASRDLLRSAVPHSTPGFSIGTYSLIAAGLLLAASVVTMNTPEPVETAAVQRAPVVAMQSEVIPASLSAPTMVAAMPAGMPLWPAVFIAQEAPWHLASDEASR